LKLIKLTFAGLNLLSLLFFSNSAFASQYKNLEAGRCMNVFSQNGTPSGYSKVHLYDCQTNSDPEQNWISNPNRNGYKQLVLGANSSFCLNVGAPINNQEVFPYSCIWGDPGQMLDFEVSSGNIGRLQFSGKGVCLQAVKATNRVLWWSNYDLVIARNCSTSNAQQWIKIN
jgi:hypothetical protein